MVYPIFVIKDSKVGFMNPAVDQNDFTAIRNLRVAMSDDHSIIKLHASDFSLYKIGTFDSESGIIDAFPSPEFVADAISLKEDNDGF